MGISYRKSVKAGPFRLNFSKSGLGVSTGIKGLRVGVNAKGQSYVGGGVAGFQYRQNLSSKSKNNSDTSEGSIEENFYISQISKQTTSYEPLLFMLGIVGIVILSIYIGWPGFAISLALLVSPFFIMNARSSGMAFFENNINEPLDEERLTGFKDSIKKIKNFSKNPSEVFQYYLVSHIKNSFKDRSLSELEKELLILFKNNLTSEAFETAVMSGFAAILLEAVEDEDFNEAERNFLNEFIDLVQLQNDMKGMLEELITYFSQIEDLRKAETLESITPSLSVGEANETIYYESKATIQKSKNVSEDGTILVSDKNLHIYTGGHSKAKISDIIEMSCDQIAFGSLYITVKNRKTPLQIKCDDTLIALEFLRKMKTWSEKNS